MEAIAFAGGEPFLYLDRVIELARHAGAAGIPYIRTGTNGFMFAGIQSARFDAEIHKMVEQLACTTIRNIWFSLDSAIPEVHEEMRGFSGLVRGMEKALPIFHEHGIYPSVNLGINRRVGGASTAFIYAKDSHSLTRFYKAYRTAFRQFYELAIKLGFTIVNTCYPISISNVSNELQSVYMATSENDIVNYSEEEKAQIFKALLDTIPEFRSHIRIFSPQLSLYTLYNQYQHGIESYACRSRLDFFFVDSKEGNTYPCDYRGDENLGKNWQLDINRINADNSCRKCDWEYLRDPSELLDPLIDCFRSPVRIMQKFFSDPM